MHALRGVKDLRRVSTRVQGVNIPDGEVWKRLSQSGNVTLGLDAFRNGRVYRGISDFSLRGPATADEIVRHAYQTLMSPEWAAVRQELRDEGADELRWWFWLKDQGQRVGCIVFTPVLW